MNDYRKSHSAAQCARDYDAHYNSGRGYFYWNYFEKPYLEKLFARLAKEIPGRYLDFACGTGRILEIGAAHFIDSVGIDVSENMLAVARQKAPNVHLIRADLTADAPEIGRFTVISLFRFLLNAEDELRSVVLSWLRKVIAPGGVLIVNNHLNTYSLAGRFCQLRNLLNGEPKGRVLSDREVKSVLGRFGFNIFEQHGFGLIPPWRKRKLFPSSPLLQLEKGLTRIKVLQNYTQDRIYLCHPI